MVHGATPHHGRFAFADAVLQRNVPALVAAAGRLLRYAGVEPRSVVSVIRGLDVHHFEIGSGPPLLLLHGASGGAANWYRVLPQLSRRHRVLAIDLPGFGFSDALDPVAPLGPQVARLLLDWLDASGIERVSVAGTSFGGLAALRMAQLAPHRVDAVALIDTVGFGRSLPVAVRIACLPFLSALALRPTRSGLRWQFETLLTANSDVLPQAERDSLFEYLWQSARHANRAKLARAFRLFTSFAGQREVLTDQELCSLRTRLLILWGEHDRLLPKTHAERATALVPGAVCRIIPRAGHSPNWEAPAAVAECLDAFFPA
jgi:pimeloyl-ACP methyl ester carboxylesterase